MEATPRPLHIFVISIPYFTNTQNLDKNIYGIFQYLRSQGHIYKVRMGST
jgi:hypothetical protein